MMITNNNLKALHNSISTQYGIELDDISLSIIDIIETRQIKINVEQQNFFQKQVDELKIICSAKRTISFENKETAKKYAVRKYLPAMIISGAVALIGIAIATVAIYNYETEKNIESRKKEAELIPIELLKKQNEWLYNCVNNVLSTHPKLIDKYISKNGDYPQQ